MKTIREIMRPSFLFRVPKTAPVAHAVRAMAHHDVGIVAVVDGGELVGVFSERDVVRRVVDHGLDPLTVLVADVMTTQVIYGDADEDCQAVMRKMDEANIRHLPILSNGRVVSMLSIRDLMRAQIADAGEELDHLRSYLYQVPTEPAILRSGSPVAKP